MVARRDCANALRFLSIDAVQQANSGHPGMPMGMADIAEVLWRDYLQVSPSNPQWFNRDRFVLSNGHGAMLQYALLHLSGFDVSLEDLRQFRQLHSKTPGHPEWGDTPGVETSTGPLGQGLANAVGLALAEKHMAATFNRDSHTVVDHFTYVFCGDGCLMEGLSHEACSLAGTWGLGKLIVFWDDNGISIDGNVEGWFTDDTPRRFEAYGWQVLRDVDGHQSDSIKEAIDAARQETGKPTLICCKTTIGFGSPNLADTAKVHGSPLGDEEIALVREQLNWSHAPFEVPEAIRTAWDKTASGRDSELLWNDTFSKYETAHPELARELLRRRHGDLPEEWSSLIDTLLKVAVAETKAQATRKSSLVCLNQIAPHLPELIGGSADLSGSNCTDWEGAQAVRRDTPDARYIEYGVREFAMAAVMNGLALYGGVIPFGGTFLVFSDYARNAIRLSALMQQRVIYVLTHDSIGLGEDGPTHQPVEHAASLRLIPGLNVWRPADLMETVVAWRAAIEANGPTCLLLSRQNLPQQQHNIEQAEDVARGGYVLWEEGDAPQGIFIATGSEVSVAVAAAQKLAERGIATRVVSMPSLDVFLKQSVDYQLSVLPSVVSSRVAIEAGVPDPWIRFVGDDRNVMGVNRFGLSAPAQQVFEAFALTVDQAVQRMNDLLT